MKKIVVFILACGLMITFIACTNSPIENPQNNVTAQPTAETVVNKTNQPDLTTQMPTIAPEITEQPPLATPMTEATAPANKNTDKFIAREKAIEIALKDAGLAKGDVYDLEAELDREYNGVFWEVSFDTREFEYSYDLDAETGDIKHKEKERNN